MPGFSTDVAALDHQVVVRTATPTAKRAVDSMFRNMRGRVRPDSLGRLTLRRVPSGWIVSGVSGVGAVHGSLAGARADLQDMVTGLFMNARPDLLWLHAAGVAKDGRAIIITGPSGSGKSTLASRLIATGFAYIADDVLPVDPRARTVHPFPVAPVVRRAASEYLIASHARRLGKEDVLVKPAQVASGPLSIAAIVVPRFSPGPSRMQRMPAGRAAIEVLQQCCNFGCHREAAVRAMGALAEAVPAWTLSFADPVRGTEAIASVVGARSGCR